MKYLRKFENWSTLPPRLKCIDEYMERDGDNLKADEYLKRLRAVEKKIGKNYDLRNIDLQAKAEDQMRRDMVNILVENGLSRDHLKSKSFKEIESLFDKHLIKKRFDL